MTVGIGVFIESAHLWQNMDTVHRTVALRVRLYSFSAYDTNKKLPIHGARKITSFEQNN